MKRTMLSIALLMIVSVGQARDLKITEEYDEFTREAYYLSGNVKVCQPKSAGMAPCAGLRLLWAETAPDVVVVRIKITAFHTMSTLAFNVAGDITNIEADVPITDVEYNSTNPMLPDSLRAKSSNEFSVPIALLDRITQSEADGVFRVYGISDATTFDFYRKASFGKTLPVDKLRQFLAFVANQTASQ